MKTEVTARLDFIKQPCASPGIGSGYHESCRHGEQLLHEPHHCPCRLSESKPSKLCRHPLAVIVIGMFQQQVIVGYLSQPDAAPQEVPLDVRQLHKQCKGDGGHVESLSANFCLGNLLVQYTLQSVVGKRIIVAR